jgi:eukaryotic-like serine/threonine-protein kinase
MATVFSTGQVVDGRYEILAPLAEGGMGAVYRARRCHLGDDVAIKIIRPDHADRSARERFMRESRACATLRHPNIVSILDFNIDGEGHPFLVMELLSGPSLRDEIAARGRLDIADVQRILPPLCAALQLAHNRNIVHRDIKPANIVAHDFGSGDRVYKLVDFGLANVRESTDATPLTGMHQFLGTVPYASPEQLTGKPIGPRSDVYSLGAVIFEMLTGRVPFDGDNATAIFTAHMTAPPPRPGKVRSELPAWVDVAVARAMAKSPEDRWPSVSDLGSIIAASASSRPSNFVPSMSSLLTTYELGERLGPGRLGSDVYRGVHRALGHPVAIRVLRHDSERSWEGVRARLLREAKTLQVSHPSVIQVRDYGEEADMAYVVTDLIEGASLRELLVASGALSWQRLKPLLAQLIDAARALHRRRGLLCGLSPEIIRVAPASDDETERLMISSAGIWQAQDLLATLHEQTLRGTELADVEPRYVAPELLTGQSADVRSDIFTMGVLAYEMATARRPYEASSMPTLLGAMLRGAPDDPRIAQPDLPPAAAAAIHKALRPSPAERFATAKEFGAALFSE